MLLTTGHDANCRAAQPARSAIGGLGMGDGGLLHALSPWATRYRYRANRGEDHAGFGDRDQMIG
jgi:hypothetical protein